MAYEGTTGHGDAKTGSLDSGHGQTEMLKGDIVVGAIAGEEVRQATAREHELSFMEAIRLYPAAVGWSMFFSLGIIIRGTDCVDGVEPKPGSSGAAVTPRTEHDNAHCVPSALA
ncbi:hypothetical protein LTR53_002328 [Teratosphaeriaceae sp. CCFEE 6253]|nr:hypothetical protein LTR53_002328 [Teratosphaeriaceae sp. CCFEE 6253]